MNQAHQAIEYRRYKLEQWETARTEVAVEAPVSLTVNGRAWLTFMCTPVELEVGFLFNEGVFEAAAEVASVRVCPTHTHLYVWLRRDGLRRDVSWPRGWARLSGCTRGAMPAAPHVHLPRLVDGVRLPAKAVGQLMTQRSCSCIRFARHVVRIAFDSADTVNSWICPTSGQSTLSNDSHATLFR